MEIKQLQRLLLLPACPKNIRINPISAPIYDVSIDESIYWTPQSLYYDGILFPSKIEVPTSGTWLHHFDFDKGEPVPTQMGMGDEVPNETALRRYSEYVERAGHKVVSGFSSIESVNNSYGYGNHTCIRVDAANFLPSPAPGTPAKSVMSFRQEYRADLRKFTLAINKLIHQMDKGELDAISLRDIVLDSTNDFQKALNRAKMKYDLKSLSTFFAIIAEADNTWQVVAKSLKYLVTLTGYKFDLNQEEYERLKGREFAYIVHAQKQFSGNT